MADLSNIQPDSRSDTVMDAPDQMKKVRDLFGIDSDMEVPAFSEADERLRFDPLDACGAESSFSICCLATAASVDFVERKANVR